MSRHYAIIGTFVLLAVSCTRIQNQSSGLNATSQDQFSACVKSVRGSINKAPTDPNDDLNAGYFINGAKLSKTSYSTRKAQASDQFVTSLIVDQYYQPSDATKLLNVTKTLQAGFLSDNRPIVTVETKTKYISNNLVTSELAHIFIFYADQNCAKNHGGFSSTVFTDEGNGKVIYKSNGNSVEIDRNDLVGYSQSQMPTFVPQSFPDHSVLHIVPAIVLSIDLQGMESRVDTTTGQPAQFKHFSVLITNKGNSSTMDVYASLASDYSVRSTANMFEETLNEKLWQQAQFDLSPPPPTLISMSGFSPYDLNNFNLNYTVTSKNGALNFDNYAAYFDMKESPAADQAGTSHVYHVENHQLQVDQEWQSIPLSPDQLTQDLLAATKTTYYYDYDNPIVQASVANVKANLGSRPTQGQIVTAILNEITAKIKQDTQTPPSETVVRRASKILAIGNGVCQHYATVFTAIARALGIPSRRVFGFQFAPGPDNLSANAGSHEWVEVNLSGKRWVPLEEQITNSLVLPDPTYFPLMVQYDAPLSEEDIKTSSNFAIGVGFSK